MYRFPVLALLAAVLSGFLLVQPAVAQGMRATGHGTSAGPTPMAGGVSVLSMPGMQSGRQIDISQHRHWTGTESKVGWSTTFVVRSKDDWDNVWRRNVGTPPPVDLPEGSMAVAVFLGPKDSEGYSVSVANIRADGQSMNVMYVESKPDDPEHVRQVPTSPWVIQMVPMSEGRVRFVKFMPPQ